MNDSLHENEIPIDIGLVRKLVDDQFPEFSGLSLNRLGASGSTNVLFRLGSELLVRLPRQPGGSASIGKERRWSREIGRHLPVDVPEIVATGEPAFCFDEHWSIVGWLDGEHPQACSPDDPPTPERSALAAELADVMLALRAIDVPEAAATDPDLRSYRGRSLVEFDKWTRRNIEQCQILDGFNLDLDAAQEVWSAALDLPGASEIAADCWYHSDLVAENLLLTGGRLSGVLDFGGLSVGDPTIDLHGAWELFDAPAREVFRNRLEIDDAQWLRGRAWALAIALGAFSYYWTTMPGRMRDRMAMARSVLADAAGGS